MGGQLFFVRNCFSSAYTCVFNNISDFSTAYFHN